MISAKLILIWVVAIALGLTAVPAGAQDCPVKRVLSVERTPFPINPSNPLGPINAPPLTIKENYYIVRHDVQAGTFHADAFNTFYHPVGDFYQKITTLSAAGRTDVVRRIMQGPVSADCCHCGDDQNAGYMLKLYSKDQNPTRGEKLDKPILVTQGFDSDYRLPEDQFTFSDFHDLLNTVNDTATGEHPTGENGLLSELYEEGYDIVLLLFKNPLIDLQVNARVVLEALRWLEGRTEVREGTEPVIIGPSMGGLITRYALQLAGQDFPASGIRARLFIAFDSPNRGAEIPMSIQALLTYVADDDVKAYIRLGNLQSVAARQMLLSSVSNASSIRFLHIVEDYEHPDSLHGLFMNEINAPGFRAQIKNITHPVAGKVEDIYTAAIINGSGIGMDLGLPPHFKYADLGCTFCLLDLELRTTAPGGVSGVFFGDAFTRDPLSYLFGEPAFIENGPGGLRPTYNTIHDTFEGLKIRGGEILHWNLFDPRFENHSFIPSISGAGLVGENINNNFIWFRPLGGPLFPGGPTAPSIPSVFDEVRAPSQNQRHVAVTSENKQWFLNLIHAHGPFTSIKLFDAIPTAGTGPQTSSEQAIPFASKAVNVSLPPEHRAVISSTPDGTGSIVVDNFITINGENACLSAEGQLGVESCFGPFITDPLLTEDDPIEIVLTPIPPLDVTGFIPPGTSTVLFELKDFGIIRGNTELHLVIKPRTSL